MINRRSRQIILLLFIAILCGCQLFDPSAEQIAAVKALGAASEACVYDVRDKNIKYEASKNCNSMSPLAQQYINAGGGRPDSNLKAEIEFERARVQAWMALALSASNGEASRIW